MGNFIKVPLAINPPRSFKLQALAGTATWANATGTLVSGTDVTNQDVLGGSGSGARATIAIAVGATLADVTATITSVGEGYKVGDIITFALNTTGGGASTWSEPLAFTIVAADLIAVEGSDTNPYQLIPIDNVLCIEPDSGTQIKVVTNLWDGTDTKEWLIQVDDAPASKPIWLYSDVSNAINLASQEENSQPSVVFTNDAEVINVDFT